jgi:hypothetical protein
MPNLYNWLVNKIRGVRYALTIGSRTYAFGAVYAGTYANWKHDPNPVLWIQYSDQKYTHGINVKYLNAADKAWFMNTIYVIKKANQIIDGRVFYQFLKQRRPSIVRTAYRLYFTSMLHIKLVSAGITRLDRMVYKGFPDQWVAFLNQRIAPSEMREGVSRISFSPTELRDRIAQAVNSVDIRSQQVGQNTGNFGSAPWSRRI